MSKSRDAFRTISEVSEALDAPAHVLRFWESKFTQVKPVKRAGGRRYYRPSDIELLAGIQKLLHEDGLTIKGAQKLLREQGVKHVAAIGATVLAASPARSDDDQMIEADAAPQTPTATDTGPDTGPDTQPERSAATPPPPDAEPQAAEASDAQPEAAEASNVVPLAGASAEPAAPETPPAAEAAAKLLETLPADPADSDNKAPARLFHLLQKAPPERLKARAEEIAPLLDRLQVVRDRISLR